MVNCVGYCFRPSAEEREAYGFIAVVAARGPIVIYGTLFAAIAANAFAVAVSDCEGRVLGGTLKASSMLAALGTVEGVINALAAPLIGAYADLTPYRKRVTIVSFCAMQFLVLVEGLMFLSVTSTVPNLDEEEAKFHPFYDKPLWDTDAAIIFLVVIFALQALLYEMLAVLTITYGAELTEDHAKTTHYISKAFGLVSWRVDAQAWLGEWACRASWARLGRLRLELSLTDLD
jgi:MFS family permease